MRGDRCPVEVRNPPARPHMRFVFQTMMSSRIRPPSAGGAGRTLQFTMSDDRRPQEGGGNSLLSAIARVSPERRWWSQTGSNRRPHACKARALPTELWPLERSRPQREPSSDRLPARGVTRSVVGPGRLELPTSRLSGVCSNQLSYRPLKRSAQRRQTPTLNARSHRSLLRSAAMSRKEKRRRRRPAPVYCLQTNQ